MGMCSLTPDDMNGRHWYRLLVERQRKGHGILPTHMGLTKAEFRAFCMDSALRLVDDPVESEEQQLKTQLLMQQVERRAPEYQDLQAWLQKFECTEEWPLAKIVALASMGFHHLWMDLGMESREELGQLMSDCFPELVAMNQPPMRWKKFFYRQLCQQEGVLVCKSPSCDSCKDYSECFEVEGSK